MIRKLFFGLLLLMMATTAYSQYDSMLDEGSEWYTFWWGQAGCNSILQIQGDSMIKSISYKKVVPICEWDCIFNGILYLREDTTTKQVFWKWDADTDVMIYDFSLEVGDTMFFIPDFYDGFLVLDSTTTYIPFNNSCAQNMYPTTTLETPRVFHFSTRTPINRKVVWIEGIGNIANPIFSVVNWTQGAGNEQLLCHINGEGVRDYYDLSFFCEKAVDCIGTLINTRNLTTSGKIKVYPNPSSDEIWIETAEAGIGTVEYVTFYSITGQLLDKQTLKSGEAIDVTYLPIGLIFGIVETKAGDKFSFRFIKGTVN